MNLKIKNISAKQLDKFYDEFIDEKTFLQTSKYGNFRNKLGEKNFRLGIYFNDELIGIAQFQKIKARRGTFLHIPHGPLLKKQNINIFEKTLKFFLKEYKKLGKYENCDFVRVSPLLEPNQINLFQKLKFRPAPIHLVNPEKTWILNLQQSEDDILKNMKKSTRYEIRRIKKCGITVHKGNSKKDFNIFWNLHMETVRRQKFIPFSKHTTEIELETFENNVQIYHSKIEQQYYSSSIILFDKNSAYYHQGASIYSKFPVAHATLWNAIKDAKKRGCKKFNFWGICDEKQKKHPWYGLSKFKRGFGGEEQNFLHVQDFPITSKYWLNYVVEKYRKWKRNY